MSGATLHAPAGVSWSWQADGLLVFQLHVKRKVVSETVRDGKAKQSSKTVSAIEGYVLKDHRGMWRGYVSPNRLVGDSTDNAKAMAMVVNALDLVKSKK